MKKYGALNRGLAIAGTVLVAFPIVAMLFMALERLIRSGRFRADWLIPAELFPMVFVGAVALLVAALRSRTRRALIGWVIGVMFGCIALGAIYTMASGLASGRTEPEGFVWVVAVVLIGGFVVSVGVLSIAGALLTVDLFRGHGALPAEPDATEPMPADEPPPDQPPLPTAPA